MNDHRRQLGSLLREGRAAAGLTQVTAAETLGVKQPAVSAWESGKAVPTLATLLRIADAYGVDRDELISAAALAEDAEPVGAAAS